MTIPAEQVEAMVVAEQYHHFPGTTLTACVLTLDNGYVVLGESSCIDHADFDAEIGRGLAREEAVNRAWALAAFRRADDRRNREAQIGPERMGQ